jgi:hypothetical protein
MVPRSIVTAPGRDKAPESAVHVFAARPDHRRELALRHSDCDSHSALERLPSARTEDLDNEDSPTS